MSFGGIFGGASGSGGGGGGSSIQYKGGDVTNTGAADPVLTITAKAVTLAKLADVATDTLLGRDTAATGAPEAIGVGGGIEFTGTKAIQRSALTGDVTATAGSGTTTIAADAVTDAKLRNSGACSIIGRSANSSGDPADISAASNDLVCTRTANVVAFTTINTAMIANDAVTYAKLQNVGSARLLGNTTGAPADAEEVAYGGGLEVSSVTLRIADTVPARGQENVAVDLMPTLQQQGTVNTASSVTFTFAVAASRRGSISLDVWVEDGSENVVYCKAVVVRVYRKASGDAIIVSTGVIDDPFSTAAFTLTAAVSGGNIVFTLANTSGTNRDYNATGGAVFVDLP